MGRRYNDRKTTKEETLTIDTKDLKRLGIPATTRIGVFTWKRGEREDCMSFYCSDYDGDEKLNLSYSTTNPFNDEKSNINDSIPLTTSLCNYGGKRYWFTCPGCHSRRRTLYLKQSLFRCRDCHQITYKSRNESKSFSYFSLLMEELLEDEKGIPRTRYFKGRPTRRYQRYLRRLPHEHRRIQEAVKALNL